MLFFKGSFTYNDLLNMPFSEMRRWQDEAKDIASEMSADTKKLRNM